MRSRVAIVGVLLGLGLWAAGPQTTRAQEVQMTLEIPEQITLVPGRLSVAFQRSAPSAAAEEAVREMGFEVLETRFEDTVVLCVSSSPISAEAVAVIEAHPSVTEVDVFTVPADPDYHAAVSFASTVDPDEATWIISEWGAARVLDVKSRTPEVIVGVAPGREEIAVGRLKSSPLVVDVFYVADSN